MIRADTAKASLHLGRRRLLAAAGAAPLAAGAARAQGPAADWRDAIGARVRQAIAADGLAGAVLAVGQGGTLRLLRTWGSRALVPAREAMTLDTVFDMASLTKVLVTAPAVMQLVETGRLSVEAPVASVLPEFATAPDKHGVTLRHLLTHTSGLPPDLDLSEDWHGREAAFGRALACPLVLRPGREFVYSDINFILLGLIVERCSGLRLDAYARRHILDPMQLAQSGYLPPAAWRGRIAPTQWRWEAGSAPVMTRGVVHDPTARRMGGVAGHAGLFGTIADLATCARALLDRRAGRPSLYPLRRETVCAMTEPAQPAGVAGLRGLGWDIDTPFSSPRGAIYPKGSFGHTGYTGTSVWLDPASDSFVALLTNRVHPDAQRHGIVALRRDIATLAAGGLGAGAASRAGMP